MTNAAGAYSFSLLPVLPAGQHYTVTVTNPAGYLPTQTGQGTTATDSSSGTSISGDLTTNGASDPTLDFGSSARRFPSVISSGATPIEMESRTPASPGSPASPSLSPARPVR